MPAVELEQSIKELVPFEKRQEEATRILVKYPDRIPVICEKARNSDLPVMEKKKFLVPCTMLCGEFKYIVQKHVSQSGSGPTAEQTIYLFVNGTSPRTSSLMSELYNKFRSEDGFLYIGGRQKEIIVTGGGENVAPVPIEDMIKVQMKDIVSNCMVLGDKRKHLACILTLRTVLDSANLPTDQLHPDVLAWAEELGAEATTVTELLEEDNEEVKLEIMAQIQKVNRKAISNAQKVHKFMIAPKDFSLPGGELTPTMKLKRHTVMEMYEKKIQQMYEHETQSSMW